MSEEAPDGYYDREFDTLVIIGSKTEEANKPTTVGVKCVDLGTGLVLFEFECDDQHVQLYVKPAELWEVNKLVEEHFLGDNKQDEPIH